MERCAEIFIGSRPLPAGRYATIHNPWDGQPASQVAVCSVEDALGALAAAAAARKSAASAPLHQRIAWLEDVAQRLADRAEEFAQGITAETAKPIAAARVEVARCVETLRLTAAEVIHLGGELFPTDATPSGTAALAYWTRVPVGVVVAITPFNFPLNLVAHKVAPALAAGNTVVLKPAPQAPWCGYALARLFIDSPHAVADALSVVYGDAEIGSTLVADERPRKISFTGSLAVGRQVLANAGLKKVSLELGGNAATFVAADADLAHAAARCAVGAFGNAGQVCISLQRIYVQADAHDRFAELLAAETSRLRVGSCHDETTFMSALIDDEAVERAGNWSAAAVAAGARLLVGGKASGRLFPPTILADVTDDMAIACEEVFAPVVSLIRVAGADEAFRRMNASPYGLQYSVFTDSLTLARRAAAELEAGGVVVNDIPTLRFDIQPYGGAKASGLGREGPRFALEDMTEIRSVVMR